MKEAAVLHPRLWVAAESTTPNFFMWSQLPTVARVLIDANYVEDSLQDKFILPVNWKLVLHVKLYACQVGCLPIFQKPFFFFLSKWYYYRGYTFQWLGISVHVYK